LILLKDDHEDVWGLNICI